MDKEQSKKIIENLKKNASKRNFDQSLELIFNFKDLDLKKPEQQIDYFLSLPNSTGKKKKICALVAHELEDEAKKVCDETVLVKDFPSYAKDPRKIKRLASKYDYFIVQANIMPDVAKVFGRFLGMRGKMPNPKAGCVVPPKTNLKPLYNRLQNLVSVRARKVPYYQVMIGKESQNTDELAENAAAIYDSLIHHLPKEQNNIKSVYIKLTMSKPEKVY